MLKMDLCILMLGAIWQDLRQVTVMAEDEVQERSLLSAPLAWEEDLCSALHHL